MNRHEISNLYFEWLYDWMCADRHHPDTSYRKLMMHLHNTEFTYIIRLDQNRAEDGKSLRYRFAKSDIVDESVDYILECLAGPCSVLEMMIALANRCEEDYMDDPAYGDRTRQWFWGMVTNLNLGSMIDTWYDKKRVDDVLYRFLNREYDADGRGGLFRVRNSGIDMREVEIWYQMCYFLGTFA